MNESSVSIAAPALAVVLLVRAQDQWAVRTVDQRARREWGVGSAQRPALARPQIEHEAVTDLRRAFWSR